MPEQEFPTSEDGIAPEQKWQRVIEWFRFEL